MPLYLEFFSFFVYSKNARKHRLNSFIAENRQRGRFAGFSLYVSSTGEIKDSTLCYKDGPQLPPLKFTTTCIEHGRYVIFYNERKDGVSYPKDYELTSVFNELCEVVVQGICLMFSGFFFHLFATYFETFIFTQQFYDSFSKPLTSLAYAY